ncbi:DUF4129 domain-containing protein [Thermus thermamylovorans]|uniref:DUF4129 domain-containing protein n=1 Tax=Thermus thermamylovorans TaxID=2509362 RepID=A0A4Q9B685_9DEIN|nr:DUF4129 domain-containing protein [Thermus thermamylovorans]
MGGGLLLLGGRLYPGGFLWLAFLPGLLHAGEAPFPLWLPEWALTSGLLLLLGLFLALRERPLASLFLLPPALLLGPPGLFLLGLLHGANLLEGALGRARARGEAFRLGLPGLLVPFFSALALFLLAPYPLPWPSVPPGPGEGIPAPLPGSPSGAPGGGGPAPHAGGGGGLAPWALWLLWALEGALPLALLLLLLALLPLLGRGRALPFRGFHLLPVLLALLAASLLLLYLGTLGGGGAGGAGVPHPAVPGPEALGEGNRTVPEPRARGEVGVALAGFGALLTLALLLALALFLWRQPRGDGEEARGGRGGGRGRSRREALPEDRVRRAYLRALLALRAWGLPRRAWEGPLAYQARVAARFPEVEGALSSLTRLYLPVRYGGRAGEEAAEEAETFLEAILRLCSTNASARP